MRSFMGFLAFYLTLSLLPQASAVQSANICHKIWVSQELPAGQLYSYHDPLEELKAKNRMSALFRTASTPIGEGKGVSCDITLYWSGLYRKAWVKRAYRLVGNKMNHTRAESDYWLMSRFYAWFSQTHVTNNIQSTEDGFRVAKSAQSNVRNEFLADFVPGRTLHELLTASDISEENKILLRQIYFKKIKFWQMLTQNQKDLVDRTADLQTAPKIHYKDQKEDGTLELTGAFYRSGHRVRFIIKSDNIIVDPFDWNLMTIIDPF